MLIENENKWKLIKIERQNLKQTLGRIKTGGKKINWGNCGKRISTVHLYI
jgi:hypothetical protein